MEQQDILITNGQVITPSGIIRNGTIWVSEGKIKAITEDEVIHPEAGIIDAKGNYVAPGCIDTHVHGGGGHDLWKLPPLLFMRLPMPMPGMEQRQSTPHLPHLL